jgi:hypothetical protein
MGAPLPAPESYGGEFMTIRPFLALPALVLTALRGADFPTGKGLTERDDEAPTRSSLQDADAGSERGQTAKGGSLLEPDGRVELGSSILFGNEDGFIVRVPVVQLLVFASALAVRALFIRVCDFGFRRSGDRQLVVLSAYWTRSLTQPGERSRPNRPPEIAPDAVRRGRTEQGI